MEKANVIFEVIVAKEGFRKYLGMGNLGCQCFSYISILCTEDGKYDE